MVDAAARRAVDGRRGHAGALLRGVDVAGVDGLLGLARPRPTLIDHAAVSDAVALALLDALEGAGVVRHLERRHGDSSLRAGAKLAAAVMTASANRRAMAAARFIYLGRA